MHCPADVGGNAWTLSRAERKLGLDSEVMVFQKSWLGYPADMDLQLTKNHPARSALRLLAFFIKALTRYDVFHFNFGSSLLPYSRYLGSLELSDLPLLKRLGKRIVVTYQGSDVRQKSFCASNFAISACAEPDCYSGYCNDTTDALKKKRADKFSRYADKIFSLNPDLLHVLPSRAEFLPYSNVDLTEWLPSSKSEGERFVIAHSPTNRSVKGTRYILDAVERLKDKYKNVELMLVEGLPHSKVKALYTQADLAIDQLLAGWYGGFAVEMMALGKPVVCYIREGDLKFIPSQMKDDLPIVNANPNTIYEVLLRLVEQRDQVHLIGERSRAYVERWHDPMKIALRTKEAYEAIY